MRLPEEGTIYEIAPTYEWQRNRLIKCARCRNYITEHRCLVEITRDQGRQWLKFRRISIPARLLTRDIREQQRYRCDICLLKLEARVRTLHVYFPTDLTDL